MFAAVTAVTVQFVEDSGEQRGRDVGFLAQHAAEDLEESRQGTVLGHPAVGTGGQGDGGPRRVIACREHDSPEAGVTFPRRDEQRTLAVEVDVEQQDVERRPFELVQGGRHAPDGHRVHVLLRGERGGQ